MWQFPGLGRSRGLITFAVGALSVASLAVRADTAPIILDFTGPTSITGGSGSTTQTGEINGAYFEVGSLHPTGTGVFEPFLTIQNKGVEQGYNTSGSPTQFDEKRQPNWTRPLLLSLLWPVMSPDHVPSYEFMLDLNEIATPKGLLSLDDLQIYQGAAGNYTHLNLTTQKFDDPGAVSHLQYDMNPGTQANAVLLNYNVIGKGQGSSDLNVYIPISYFDPNLPYVYLYSKMGGYGPDYMADSGYEEWRAVTPTPSAAMAGLVLLLGVAPMGRATSSRRRRAAASV
jgi:hypothetical protein